MPRIKTDEERAAEVHDGQTVVIPNDTHVDNGTTEKPKRELRPVPDGVVVGLLDEPKPSAEPVVSTRGRRGRTVDPKTIRAIELMTASPGQWFELGTFMSNASPTKDSAFGKAGVKFKNVPNENGTFTRYGSVPAPVADVPADTPSE